jgi:hypothetical protein
MVWWPLKPIVVPSSRSHEPPARADVQVTDRGRSCRDSDLRDVEVRLPIHQHFEAFDTFASRDGLHPCRAERRLTLRCGERLELIVRDPPRAVVRVLEDAMERMSP